MALFFRHSQRHPVLEYRSIRTFEVFVGALLRLIEEFCSRLSHRVERPFPNTDVMEFFVSRLSFVLKGAPFRICRGCYVVSISDMRGGASFKYYPFKKKEK